MLRVLVSKPVALAAAAQVTGLLVVEKLLDVVAERVAPKEEQLGLVESVIALSTGKAGKAALGVACAAALGAVGLYYWRKPLVLADKPLVNETVVPESIEVPTRPPNCQVWIGYPNKNGVVDVVGSGFRVQLGGVSFVATAAHNLAYDEPLFLIKGANVVIFKDPRADIITVGSDGALFRVDDKTWSKLGVTVATLSPVPSRTQTHVTVCGRNHLGTSGFLVADKSALGHVEYSATTKAGYSGAPYVSGQNVFGMHLHGGRRNGGLSAFYFLALAKCALGIFDEGAYDYTWYKRLYGKQPRGENFNAQFLGNSVVIMTDDGFAYRLDKADFEEFDRRLKIDAGDEAYGHLDDISEDSYVEECYPISGNGMSPAYRRASTSIRQQRELEELRGKLLKTEESKKQLKKRLKQQHQLYKRVSRKQQDSFPPKQEERALNAPSKSTQQSGSKS